ncbi:hypothetical protein BGZ82_007564 [Podila clonocystis]|nr:hypothetical protein BGZ82_007564 [Podila clonocystis]
MGKIGDSRWDTQTSLGRKSFGDISNVLIVHAPVPARVPARVPTPLAGHLSDDSRPVTPPTDLGADLNKIKDEFFNTSLELIKFLNEFVQGLHELPVTEGSNCRKKDPDYS